MNNQKPAFFSWNSSNAKTASSGLRSQLAAKTKSASSSMVSKLASAEKKYEIEGSSDLRAQTQHIDICFASMYKRCT